MADRKAAQDGVQEGAQEGVRSDDRPGYEEARAELIDVVRALEAGGTTLEESLALWERGERLAAVCQEWLDGARRRLDAAVDVDGQHTGG